MAVMFDVLNGVVVGYFFFLNVCYTVFFFASVWITRQRVKWSGLLPYEQYLGTHELAAISILQPAYNEEANIVESVRSTLLQQYPNFEVIVINDGSKDATLDRLKEAFSLEPVDRILPELISNKPVKAIYRSPWQPRLVVVDKENGGKADAMNAGIEVAHFPYLCTIDADVVMEPEALMRVMEVIHRDPERIIACGGIVRIANECRFEGGRVVDIRLSKKPLVVIQVLEYFRSFIAGRTALSALNALPVISGAFAVFRRDLVLAVGGFNSHTVGEDMELVLRLHRYCLEHQRPYRVVHISDPMCWTEAPESTAILRRQRGRWYRGLMDSLRIHSLMIGNPRYGWLGMFGLPFIFLSEFCSPIIEVTGYLVMTARWASGHWNVESFYLFVAVVYLYGTLLTIATILVESWQFRRYRRWQDMVTLLAWTFLEHIGYRQWHVYWQLTGLMDYLKKRHEWGAMPRKGFAPVGSLAKKA